MKAIGMYHSLPIEDPESLVDLELPTPQPTGHDLLVRVQAVSVNPVDVKVRASNERDVNDEQDATSASPRILGWDVAGIVEAVGADVTLFEQGDAVYYAGTIGRAGGNSQLHLVDERIVGLKPKTLDFAQAAALPLTTLTAWEALFDRLAIPHDPEANRGKSVLIIGASGGVGSIATQLAKLAGLTVIGTAARPESAQWATSHGAQHVITHQQPFAPQLERLGFASVEYILCLNSPERYVAELAHVVAPQGKICSILDVHLPADVTGTLADKSATLVWEYMFTRAEYQTGDMIEQHRALTRAAALVDSGALQSTLTERLSPINAANLRKAHARVESGHMIGKIVVERFPD